jgi:hypothetical protein
MIEDKVDHFASDSPNFLVLLQADCCELNAYPLVIPTQGVQFDNLLQQKNPI